MPKFEFPREYFKEHYEEEERINKRDKNKFIPIEDLPSDTLNPEEIAILKEEGLLNHSSNKEDDEDIKEYSDYDNGIDEQQEKFNFVENIEKARRQAIEQELNKKFDELEKIEEKAKEIAPKEINKPLYSTTRQEQSSKERIYHTYYKPYKFLTRSKRNQGRKPKYKDKHYGK